MGKNDSSDKNADIAREVEAEIISDEDEALSEELVYEPEIDFDDEEAESYEDDSEDTDDSEEISFEEFIATEEQPTKGLAKADPLAQYIREVQKYPLLTQEEEHELAVRYRETGDPKAAEKLVTSNLRFVIKIAAEYAKYGSKLIDVVQEGNVGLMHAVREFNPYKGVRLISYAVWWIRGYIKEYLMKQQSLVRIGTNAKQKKLFHSIRREERKLRLMGKEPNVKLLAEKLDVSEKEVVQMQQRIRHGDLSLDQSIDSDSRTQWIEMHSDEDSELQDEALARQELLNMILANIMEIKDSLNEKEQYILKKRIMEDEPKTLQEIGDHFGISRERARQLEARVLKKLKEQVQENLKKNLQEDLEKQD
jgi:RNA polymerase sigma-32 factor